MPDPLKINLFRKVCGVDRLAAIGADCRGRGLRVVHCHGCFDIVHPGHLRYLQFARQQGDVLVVSLTGDDAIEKSDGTRPYVPQELRAETLAALEFVDHVVIVDGPTAEPVIRELHPDLYIKGKEYEGSTHPGFLAERELVEGFGGRVIFSSGDVVFSSSAIPENLGEILAHGGDVGGLDETARLTTCCARWDVTPHSLRRLMADGFRGKRVAVLGDAICDHYVFCDATNVAGEAPVLSLRPLNEARYLGGAAIIAAHLAALGAKPHLITVVGQDEPTEEMLARLDALGVTHTTLPIRRKLPLKLRYLVEAQKLLKVDHADAQPLDSANQRTLLAALAELRSELDALILADFGCGTLTTPLLAQALPMLRPHVNVIAGDVSGPRRTLLAFHNADLLTPNERELRSVVGDFDRSLPTVAISLMRQIGLKNLAVTMGARGCLLFRPREDAREDWFHSRLRSEYLPTLASRVIDPLGAGDALLATATLALAAGATLTQAGYLGSAAGAITVGRIGNNPVSTADLQNFLRHRPELAAGHRHAAG
ncbi:MAG: PfkB family carbohydrate kinase [Planctomycetota bacterium]|nr:PfkB family carbohydrate kinase [Planctomycetota bacterium]